MNLYNSIQTLLEQQLKEGIKAVVDLQLYNGNILLKSFHITHWDEHLQTLTGLTMNEGYSYVREQRDPVYCNFKLDEIKEIIELQYTSILLPSIER